MLLHKRHYKAHMKLQLVITYRHEKRKPFRPTASVHHPSCRDGAVYSVHTNTRNANPTPPNVHRPFVTTREKTQRRVRFVGWVDGGPDLEHLLAGMSLLFNPSLMASETFSVINIQAMAVGTPVAAFGTAGMLEYLSPGVNALVLDEAEPRKVATALAELLLDRPRLDALAERGRKDVLSNFRADTAVERWADLYESLMGRGAWAVEPGKTS